MGHGFTSDKFIRGLQRARVPASPVGYMTNLTATARDGTSVAGHATVANSAGAFVEVINSTTLDSHGVWVQAVEAVSTTGVNNSALLSLATGGAGAESIVVPDMDFSNLPVLFGANAHHGFRAYHFPGLYIPAGTRISLQLRTTLTAHTHVCSVALDPMLTVDVVETSVVAYGANQAASSGTSVTPGSGAFGSWVEIGTTSRDHSVWAVGYGPLADTTLAQASVLIEIAFGPNSGALTSIGVLKYIQNAGEIIVGSAPATLYSDEVPSGTKVWARIASGETEARSIIIYGV